jgi:hypothetical protein
MGSKRVLVHPERLPPVPVRRHQARRRGVQERAAQAVALESGSSGDEHPGSLQWRRRAVAVPGVRRRARAESAPRGALSCPTVAAASRRAGTRPRSSGYLHRVRRPRMPAATAPPSAFRPGGRCVRPSSGTSCAPRSRAQTAGGADDARRPRRRWRHRRVRRAPLAELGHRVTVVDPSPTRSPRSSAGSPRPACRRRVARVPGDTSTLAELGRRPRSQTSPCATACSSTSTTPARRWLPSRPACDPVATLSVLAANRYAVVIARAVAGHVSDARYALADPDGRWGPGDPMPRRFSEEDLHRPARRCRPARRGSTRGPRRHRPRTRLARRR